MSLETFGHPIEYTTEVMGMLNLNVMDLNNPTNLSRFKEVLDFFSKDPSPTYTLSKLLANKNGDSPFDKVYGLVQMNKEESVVVQAIADELIQKIKDRVANGMSLENIKKISKLL